MSDAEGAEEGVTSDPAARVNSPSAALVRLADACGIAHEYLGWDSKPRRCSAAAIRDALAAMGVVAGDDAVCQREYDRLAAEKALRVVPPVVVARLGAPIEVAIHAPKGTTIEARLILESGEEVASTLVVRSMEEPEDGASRLVETRPHTLPSDLPLGYHSLEIKVGSSPIPATCAVIVTPDRIDFPDRLRTPRPWGLMAQLYSVRSKESWGIGDLVDLRDLCILGAQQDADFVLINPLHAAEPVVPLTPSPYLPMTRRFVHPLYIRVEDIPEAAYLDSSTRSLVAWLSEKPREASLNRLQLDRDTAWEAKQSALEEVFRVPLTAGRQAQFDAFVEEQGEALTEFATWAALVEARAIEGVASEWPAPLASPHASGVGAFRAAQADRVRFWSWLQWVADEQRAAAQVAAKRAGMRIGVMTDLAVGVHPAGADAWALTDVLARGVGVGAPPDMYNQQGQNWSQPPWQPRVLEEAAYAPFRDVVRAALRHAGAVRVDHILGAFRLWWVPEGHAASDGVYVKYDHEALIGILALEATRAGAIVIGEDLGTVEDGVADYLESRGILGTSVFWFQKRDDGSPRPPEDYRPGELTSVTIHDLPPTAAYLAGEHVTLREKLGVLVRPVEQVRAEAAAERAAIVAMLQARGWLTEEAASDPDEVLIALERAIFATPCALVGVTLTDLVGDVRAQNQPGTNTEYPNWKVPLCDGHGAPITLDVLFQHPLAKRVLAAIHDSVRGTDTSDT